MGEYAEALSGLRGEEG